MEKNSQKLRLLAGKFGRRGKDMAKSSTDEDLIGGEFNSALKSLMKTRIGI